MPRLLCFLQTESQLVKTAFISLALTDTVDLDSCSLLSPIISMTFTKMTNKAV